MSFRTTNKDPRLISLQIISLQTGYYSTCCLINILLVVMTGDVISLSHLLDSKSINVSTAMGLLLSANLLISSFIM